MRRSDIENSTQLLCVRNDLSQCHFDVGEVYVVFRTASNGFFVDSNHPVWISWQNFEKMNMHWEYESEYWNGLKFVLYNSVTREQLFKFKLSHDIQGLMVKK